MTPVGQRSTQSAQRVHTSSSIVKITSTFGSSRRAVRIPSRMNLPRAAFCEALAPRPWQTLIWTSAWLSWFVVNTCLFSQGTRLLWGIKMVNTSPVAATPRASEQTDSFGNTLVIGLLGVTRSGVEYARHDPFTAVWRAGRETWDLTVGTLEAVGQIIVGARGAQELGGPIRIAQMSGEFAKVGIVPFDEFVSSHVHEVLSGFVLVGHQDSFGQLGMQGTLHTNRVAGVPSFDVVERSAADRGGVSRGLSGGDLRKEQNRGNQQEELFHLRLTRCRTERGAYEVCALRRCIL